MHRSLAGSAVLMLLLLFALGNFVGVQPGLVTRDADNGQLMDNRRNLRLERKTMSLFKSLDKRADCSTYCFGMGICQSGCYCGPGHACMPNGR
uniref:Conotoxin Im9.4 n=1 Tax=Conus imperialis TaxID=35631 RepID=CP94_CONIM|nr:RecName: Full=Conotoxin Im9.4; AltName: Full=Conopeptide im022; Flags: Precursor [Conus imperialis]AME17680.1 conopeptide im022 [Conus imperialis]